MSFVTSTLTSGYYLVVPPYIDIQLKGVASELNALHELVLRGPVSHRYSGEGDAFLKERHIYHANNPWELGRTALFLGIIFTTGYLLSKVGAISLSISCVLLASFFATSVLRDYKGNPLERALNLIVPEDKRGALPEVQWKPRSIWPFAKAIFDMEAEKNGDWKVKICKEGTTPVGYLFKLKDKRDKKDHFTVHAFYFGTRRYSRSHKTEGQFTINSTSALKGSEVGPLLDLVKTL